MKSKQLKTLYKIIENSVKYHYPFLDNTEQKYLSELMKCTIPVKRLLRESDGEEIETIDLSKINNPKVRAEIKKLVKTDGERAVMPVDSPIWKRLSNLADKFSSSKIGKKLSKIMPNRHTPSKLLNKAARKWMDLRASTGDQGILSAIFGKGTPYEIMPTTDSKYSDFKSYINHAFPDFWGSRKTQKFVKNWLIKDPDGTYRVNNDLKKRLGGENDPAYKLAKDIADTYTLKSKDLLTTTKQDQISMGAELNSLVNKFEDVLFVTHKDDMKKDPELKKMFNKLKGNLITDFNPESAKVTWLDPKSIFTAKFGRQRNLDDTSYKNSPEMEKLYQILGDKNSTFEDRKNALRLFNKNVRRNKEFNNAGDKLKYAIGNAEKGFRNRKKEAIGILHGKL